MQELAEAGAKVLNAQAVEFAKERGIVIYARSSHGGTGETVICKQPPRAPGRAERQDGLSRLVGMLDKEQVGGKQLYFEQGPGGEGSATVVLSLENTHA